MFPRRLKVAAARSPLRSSASVESHPSRKLEGKDVGGSVTWPAKLKRAVASPLFGFVYSSLVDVYRFVFKSRSQMNGLENVERVDVGSRWWSRRAHKFGA